MAPYSKYSRTFISIYFIQDNQDHPVIQSYDIPVPRSWTWSPCLIWCRDMPVTGNRNFYQL